MSADVAAQDEGLVSRDRVTEAVRHLLYVAVHVDRRMTVNEIARRAKLSVRKVRTYMANDPVERREPSLSAALSLAVVLGEEAVNDVLSLIGFGGARCLGEAAEQSAPMQIVACLMAGVNDITQRAADGEFCKADRKELRKVADRMIAKLIPFSSAAA